MLKKIFIGLLVFILMMVALSSVGPLVGLAISLVVLYFAYKQFHKSTSFWGKAFWVILGIIALFSGIGNLPALVGILALYLLYVLYKKWKQQKGEVVFETSDPFTNFENQWNKMTKF